MKRSDYLVFLAIGVALLLVVLSMSVFQVEQYQKAIVFKFRQVNRVDVKPGIHYMIPFVNDVVKFDVRILALTKETQRFLTKEKKDVLVDYYVKWRIVDEQKFYGTARSGDVRYANGLIEQRVNRALRDEFGKRTIQEVVAGERGEILNVVAAETAALSGELGIAIIDVRTIRIDLPDEVSASVYKRMRAERLRVAKEFRAQGHEAAERIRADSDRGRTVLIADAQRDSDIIHGTGDAKAASIYANAYNRNRDFYAFYRSLRAYNTSFNDRRDFILLSPDSEFFRYLKSSSGKPMRGTTSP